MGQKQTAIVIDVSNKENACHACITDIQTACQQVLVLNAKIEAATDFNLRKKLITDKNTPYGTLIKSRAKLVPLIAAYDSSVSKLEKFIAEKQKRWIGKSTLPQAQHFLKDTKEVQKDYHDLIEYSKTL